MLQLPHALPPSTVVACTTSFFLVAHHGSRSINKFCRSGNAYRLADRFNFEETAVEGFHLLYLTIYDLRWVTVRDEGQI